MTGRLLRTGGFLAALVLVPGTACARPSNTPGTGGASAQQSVQATQGALCTHDKYNGGVPKLDLTAVTVGFAQSEKEANPFRITETQSIKEEAAKRGIKLITTNAQSAGFGGNLPGNYKIGGLVPMSAMPTFGPGQVLRPETVYFP